MHCTSSDHDSAALMRGSASVAVVFRISPPTEGRAIDRVWIEAVLRRQAGLGPCAKPARPLRDVACNLADLELSDNANTAPRWRIVAGQCLKRDNTRMRLGMVGDEHVVDHRSRARSPSGIRRR